MNEPKNEEFPFEETSYEITPEGSSFWNCTPKILGPQYDRILSLNYSRMLLIGIQIEYYWDSWNGMSIPRPILKFKTPGKGGDITFSILCKMDYLAPDLSRSDNEPLPDMNEFTPFSENYSSMEIHHYCHDLDPNRVSEVCQLHFFSIITLKNKYKKLDFNCIDLSFSFDD